MHLRCRHFPLMFTLAAAAVTPAFAQAVAPRGHLWWGRKRRIHSGFLGVLDAPASWVRAAIVGSHGAGQPVAPRERYR
jgi:hypothetical protein